MCAVEPTGSSRAVVSLVMLLSIKLVAFFLFFFFFQAEDGIRDGTVTGVQTCALPILQSIGANALIQRGGLGLRLDAQLIGQDAAAELVLFEGRAALATGPQPAHQLGRSEERRVGKECRSRWSADHGRKKRRREPGRRT